jgi:hypothetical protein
MRVGAACAAVVSLRWPVHDRDGNTPTHEENDLVKGQGPESDADHLVGVNKIAAPHKFASALLPAVHTHQLAGVAIYSCSPFPSIPSRPSY